VITPFGHFDSGRASNASYEDTQFSSYRHSWEWFGAEPRGATRFQYRRGEDYGPHGDTHLRTVKQFDPDELVDGFYETTDRLLSVIASESSFRRPVTAAIDITTIPYYGDVEEMSMVSGTKDRDGRAFKFATLSIIGQNIPLILAVEPVRESSLSGMRTRRIRSIVLCDGSFDERKSMFQSRQCCVIESLTRYKCSRHSQTSM